MSDNANKFGTFQSTLPRRERQVFFMLWRPREECFNPRSREGSDEEEGKSDLKRDVSIHAPAKGATGIFHAVASSRRMFQSTLPRRERLKMNVFHTIYRMFQSTLPRRERRNTCKAVPPFDPEFQSTLPRRERRGIRRWAGW